jgi:hypothetical protein
VTGKNKWDGKVYDREDTFKTIIKQKIDIKYIETGKTAEINFGKFPPDSIKVYDILLDDEGNNMYTEREIIEIPVELNDGKYSFKIENHIATALSSNSDDYQEGKKWNRGFRIIAAWGENECEFAFIIKTDGMITFKEIN